MRRNHRRKIFNYLFILFICITLSSIPSIQEVGVLGAPTSPFSPNSSEFDTIDSFDVHPLNRWDITDGGFTATISEGLFLVSDVGDTSLDAYYYDRDLRSLDGVVETRFKFDSNGTGFTTDRFEYKIFSDSAGTDIFQVRGSFLVDASYAKTELMYLDIDNNLETLALTGIERFFDNTWYILKFDYDILKSDFRIRCFFDNGSKVFDYDWFDISLNRPIFFAGTTVTLRNYYSSITNGLEVVNSIDYVKAPFKERNWDHYDDSADADFLYSSLSGYQLQDDIDDTDGFRITVMDLDQWKGEFRLDAKLSANWALGDSINYSAYLYVVDDDDGDLHEVFRVELHAKEGVGGLITQVEVYVDGIEIMKPAASAPAFGEYVWAEFSMVIPQGRTDAILDVQGDAGEGDHISDIWVFQIDLSDVTSDYSSEFVLSMDAEVYITGNGQAPTLDLIASEIIERGEFSGKNKPLVPREEFVDTGGGIFDWIGGIFITALRGLGVFLAPFFLALGEIFEKIQGWLNTAAGVITTAIGNIASDIWTAMGDALDFITDAIDLIQDWVGGIIDDFIAGAQEFIEAIILGLINLLSDVWDFIVGGFFFVWDLIGLPDILAIAAVGLDGIVAILLGAPAFILSVINDWILPFAIIIICIYWFRLVFLSFAEEGFEPLAGFSNFVERLVETYDLTILGVGPLPIPIALFFIPMTYFLIVVPSGSIFAIW